MNKLLRVLMVASMLSAACEAVSARNHSSKRDNQETKISESQLVTESGVKYQTVKVKGVPLRMVWIEGGSFSMGKQSVDAKAPFYDASANSDEAPVHEVTLSGFYLGQTEVTQALWQAVTDSNPSYHQCMDCPVERVTWADCLRFCNALSHKLHLKPYYDNITDTSATIIAKANGFRLPTESQWEFAARGGQLSRKNRYVGSDSVSKVAWYNGYSYDPALQDRVQTGLPATSTGKVAQLQPNELGLYDMSGNVWEWVFDRYSHYPRLPLTDPMGPAYGSYHVLRGGSWLDDGRHCRPSFRVINEATDCYNVNGLRIVCPVGAMFQLK